MCNYKDKKNNQGICVKRFSLGTYEVVDDVNNTELCGTNYTMNTTLGTTCMPGPFLDSSSIRLSDSQQHCHYHTLTKREDGQNDTYIKHDTSCGMAKTHVSICPLMQGDRSYL